MSGSLLATASLSLGLLLLAPRLIPRARLSPVAGICLWTTTLFLRAALMIAVAVAALVVVPQTRAFQVVAEWCLHTMVPFVDDHLQVGGHGIADAAILVPTLLIVGSATAVFFGAWRAAVAVSRWLRRTAIGRRSDGSVIVGDRGMIMASAGLRRPEVVVSAGALMGLEDDELAAGLAHEQGHVRRCHRFVTALSLGFVGAARVLPGTNRAYRELHYHLERDADEYAVRRTGNPLALASAICKVAGAGVELVPGFPRYSLSGLTESRDRLQALIDREPGCDSAPANRRAWLLVSAMSVAATGLVVVVVGVGVAEPGTAHALTGLTNSLPICA